MSSSLGAFNVVLVGDNFPVASMSAADFKFRGRDFTEKMRLGPILQASTRGVDIQAFPERFDVSITAPDDLDIQCEGAREVTSTFLEFVGRRTINAVGHNAHVRVDDAMLGTILDGMVRSGVASDLMGVAGNPTRNVTFRVVQEDGAQLSVTVGADDTPGAVGGVINFNFNFNVKESGQRDPVGFALGQLRGSLGRAEELAATIITRFRQEAVQ